MYMQDVIGELRQTQLLQSLKITALESQQAMLERFTWNLITKLAAGQPVVDALKEAKDSDATPLYFQTLIDLAIPEAEAGLGPSGSAS